MTSHNSSTLPTPPPPSAQPRGRSVPQVRHPAYYTYPITHTVSSLLRRLSGDTPRTGRRSASQQSRASSMRSVDSSADGFGQPTSHPSNGNGNSVYNATMFSAQRTASPYQPPPLTPLTLAGWNSSTKDSGRLLTRQLAEEIRLLVPARMQLVERWRLVHSLEQDGVSLHTLYKKCEALKGTRGGFVLVIKDTSGGVFGAYLSDAPTPKASYYGTGECFLWRSTILPRLPADLDLSNLPPPPSADTSHFNARATTLLGESGTSTPDRIRFKAFPYSGMNDYLLFCQAEFLSVGGGDGHYGLWLDDSLDKGISSSCPTFGNEPLSDEGSKFDVMGVEMWFLET